MANDDPNAPGGINNPFGTHADELPNAAPTARDIASVRDAVLGLGPSTGARVITPGTPVAAGRRVAIATNTAGTVALVLVDQSILEVPVPVGFTLIDNLAVVDVVAAMTVNGATVSVLN